MIGSLTKLHDGKSSRNVGVMLVYVVFITVAGLVFHLIAEGEFSSVLTLSAIFQCLAFSLIGVQALSSVQGISTTSLQLDAFALACRLSSTTWLEGYLPNDQSGDFLYQAFDALSLVMVLALIRRVQNVRRKTRLYEAGDDALPAAPFAVVSFLLAALLHGDLDDRPLFDTLWMCGLFISAVAVLPQLWMITHSKHSVSALTSHFVAVMAIGRVLSGAYMWHAHNEITCEPWIGDFNHTGYSILAAHAVHLVLLADFAYFYGKNLVKSGLQAPLEIPEVWAV
jgi:hypothetical protein